MGGAIIVRGIEIARIPRESLFEREKERKTNPPLAVAMLALKRWAQQRSTHWIGWFQEEERRGFVDRERPGRLLTFSRFKSHSFCYFNYRYLVTYYYSCFFYLLTIFIFWYWLERVTFVRELTRSTFVQCTMLLIIHRMYRSIFK